MTNSPDLQTLSQDLLERLWKAEHRHYCQLEWIRDNRLRTLQEAITRSGERLRKLKSVALEHVPRRSGWTYQDESQRCILPPHPRPAYEQQLALMLPPEIPQPQALRALTQELVSEMGLEYGTAVVTTVVRMALRQSGSDQPMLEPATAWLLHYLETLFTDLQELETLTAVKQSAPFSPDPASDTKDCE